MKKYFVLIFSLFAFVAVSTAQTRLRTVGNINEGQVINIGGTTAIPTDSLQVTDTIAYIIPVTHIHSVFPYLTWEWTKIGAGTATVVQSFTQSMDNSSATSYFPVLKGVAQSAYTKSYSLSASTPSEVDFARDTAVISGRFLKITYITSSTASVKGKLHTAVKANIK